MLQERLRPFSLRVSLRLLKGFGIAIVRMRRGLRRDLQQNIARSHNVSIQALAKIGLRNRRAPLAAIIGITAGPDTITGLPSSVIV